MGYLLVGLEQHLNVALGLEGSSETSGRGSSKGTVFLTMQDKTDKPVQELVLHPQAFKRILEKIKKHVRGTKLDLQPPERSLQ